MSVSARAPYQTLLEVIGEDGMLSAVNALNVEHPVTLEFRRGFDMVEKIGSLQRQRLHDAGGGIRRCG